MAYVIAEPCIDVLDISCVSVCPVDCIHYEEGTDRKLFIDPNECIDCGACEPECPVNAIFPEESLPRSGRTTRRSTPSGTRTRRRLGAEVDAAKPPALTVAADAAPAGLFRCESSRSSPQRRRSSAPSGCAISSSASPTSATGRRHVVGLPVMTRNALDLAGGTSREIHQRDRRGSPWRLGDLRARRGLPSRRPTPTSS